MNRSISDSPDSADWKYGNHVDINTNPNVSIPAIIGDSVRLDASTPNDMYVIANSINPSIDVRYVGMFGT